MDPFWSEDGSADNAKVRKDGKGKQQKLTGMGLSSSFVRDYDRLVT
jgi:hypothetical protein